MTAEICSFAIISQVYSMFDILMFVCCPCSIKERKKKKTSAEGFLSFTGQQTETEKPDVQTSARILGLCGVMDLPLQTGTHFPRLKNLECSSFVKQMSDAVGVLSNHR